METTSSKICERKLQCVFLVRRSSKVVVLAKSPPRSLHNLLDKTRTHLQITYTMQKQCRSTFYWFNSSSSQQIILHGLIDNMFYPRQNSFYQSSSSRSPRLLLGGVQFKKVYRLLTRMFIRLQSAKPSRHLSVCPHLVGKR